MNIQNILVGIIILFACFYIGRTVWQKVKSFSAKSSCGSDCGCEGKQNKTVKI
ncbi:MAG: FeoB-associated Cys-rich membrane protein [Acidobacteriota bacterium]|nr:FeoB-associated Cys-rich membrane protein [Acidobacteriota bacterium]